MKSRKPITRPGAFRPAAQVAAALLREATPKRQRTPRHPVSGVELHDTRVLTVRPTAGSMVATVAVTASDNIRLTVAVREFTCRGKRKAEADVVLPIATTTEGPVLTVHLDAMQDGLAPGAVVSVMRVGFRIDSFAETPAVLAMAEKVALAETEITAAPVTLAPATTSGGITDSDVGLPHDDVAQERAERFLRNVYAFQMREAAKEDARQRLFPDLTVHEEVPDESFTLMRPTDRLTPIEAGIVAELFRLSGFSMNVSAADGQGRPQGISDDPDSQKQAKPACGPLMRS
jgi:hypothetical protein